MTFTTRVTFGVLFSMLATAAFGQTTYFYLHPGDIQTLTGCLYQNGHRVQIYGVKIDWSGGSTEYVGGHNHPDPRPITSFNTTIYEDTLQTTTDSTGCSSVQTRASWYSGEYWIYANPEGPYTGFTAAYELFISNLGTPFQSYGYIFSTSDAANHPNSNWGNTVVLNDMYNAANQFYAWGKFAMLVLRVGNYEGGFLDTFSHWLPYPSVAENARGRARI